MKYNKTKKILELISGIISIVTASICSFLAFACFVIAIDYFIGNRDTVVSNYLGYYTVDMSDKGVPYLMLGLAIVIAIVILMIYAIKLIKSPYKSNGEFESKLTARVWVLIFAILTVNLPVIGLMIAIFCLKDFKQSTEQGVSIENNIQSAVTEKQTNVDAQSGFSANQNEVYELYQKILEIKKLKTLEVIDEATFKRATSKIVADLIKE